MTKLLRFCQEQWASWSRREQAEPLADTSYDEVSTEMIRRMNEHAQADYSNGQWVHETLET